MIYKFDHEYENGPKKEDKITEELMEKVREDFLDHIYGARTKLSRKDYMDIVISK